jgi:ribonuclease P protein component
MGKRRVAFAVSRRLGGAVRRNRARRRLREAYRREQHALRAGIEAVFIGRPLVLTRPFPLLRREMRESLDAMSRDGAGERDRGKQEQ